MSWQLYGSNIRTGPRDENEAMRSAESEAPTEMTMSESPGEFAEPHVDPELPMEKVTMTFCSFSVPITSLRKDEVRQGHAQRYVSSAS